MNNAAEKINYTEAELFYKSPYALVDYTSVQSFTLIKSCIELFAYYGAEKFTGFLSHPKKRLRACLTAALMETETPLADQTVCII